MRRVIEGLGALLVLVIAGQAWAGRDAEDLRRQIDAQRAAVNDLERLDETHAVPAEIALLRTWLDEASGYHAKENWDWVRSTLDRCVAQAELIRQQVIAAKASRDMREREAALRSSRDKIAKAKEALMQSMTTKKALEMNAK